MVSGSKKWDGTAPVVGAYFDAGLESVAKANKNVKIVVSFKAPELKRIVGYVVQRATDKNFSKNVKTFNTKKTR